MNLSIHCSMPNARLVSISRLHVRSPLGLMAVTGTISPSQTSHGDNDLRIYSLAATSHAQSPSSFSNPHIPATLPNRLSQESYNSSRDASVGVQSSSAATFENHDRWCFICKDQKYFNSRDNFRRHMLEHHYETYYCISESSVDLTAAVPICAVCRFPNPNVKHLNQHNDCKGCGKKYTRKRNMAKHYKKHGVQNFSALAERSKQVTDQRSFVCGFCIFRCDSHNELINHVDYGHFKSLEHIRNWDDDKVILGLLSQHTVSDYWRALLAACPHLQESYFTWKPTDAEELIRRLGVNLESGDILAQATFNKSLAQAIFNKSNFGTIQRDDVQSIPLTNPTDEDINNNQTIQTLQRAYGLSLPYILGRGVASHVPLMPAPTLPSQRLASESGHHSRSSRTASEMHGSYDDAMYRDAGHRTYPFDSQIGGQNFTQYAYPAYWPSAASASGPSQMLEDPAGTLNSSGLDDYSPDISSYVTTNPQLRQMSGTHSQPVAQARQFHPSSTTQSISSPSSDPRETSQLSHLSSAYDPTVAPQSSRLEARDGHRMDVEFYSDSQRRFVQGRDPSRGQGRRQ